MRADGRWEGTVREALRLAPERNPLPFPTLPLLRLALSLRAGKGRGRGWTWGLLLALGLGLPTWAAPLESVTLQLKWRHQFQFAGYYAAQAKGYYRAHGLEVRLVEATPTLDPIQEVASGRANYGVGNSGLLLARGAGKPVVVLATLFQHSPMVLLVRAESGLNSIHDLLGRRVMLEPHSEELLAYLQREGVDQSALRLLPHSFDSQDLIDLVITLFAPDGTPVILSKNAGGPSGGVSTTGAAFGSSCGSYVVFSDLGTASIDTQLSTGSTPIVGTFRPSYPLEAFTGKSANGTWTLRLQDFGPADTGTFNCGVLSVKPLVGPSLDLNADGATDLRDLLFFAKYYGGTNAACDLNSDGSINDLDLTILLAGL